MIPTKELQLGDWVRIYDIEQQELKATGQIWEIRQEDVTVDTDGTDDHMWYCTDQCLQPIPITEDILKKYGFFYKGGIWVVKTQPRLGWYPRQHQLIVDYHTFPVDVEFVHQLQHVMRAVGLKEVEP